MAGQGSARVSLREIDLSQVRSQEQLPQGTPAGVIGTAKKGPAFVPHTFATMQQFEETFGSLADSSKNSNANKFGPLALNEWMRNADAGTFVRVLGVGDGTADAAGAGFVVGQQLVQPTLANPGKLGNNPNAASSTTGRTYMLGCFMKDVTGASLLQDSGLESGASAAPVIRGVLMAPMGVRPTLLPNSELTGVVIPTNDTTHVRNITDIASTNFGTVAGTDLAGYILGEVSNQSFTLLLNGFTNIEQPVRLVCSFDPSSTNYFAKVLNTDPTKIEECGHYLYAHWDVEKEIALPDVGNVTFNHSGAGLLAFCVHNTLDATRPNYENFNSRFKSARSPWVVSQAFEGNESDRTGLDSSSVYKLFKLHALDDGEIGHQQYRVLVSNISLGTRDEFGSFNLSLESIDSDPVSGNPLIEWRNINLDPESKNFIGRIIGDRHVYWDFDKDESRQRLVETGEYPVRNKFVRVEISSDVIAGVIPRSSLPTGFQGPGYLNTAVASNFSGEDTKSIIASNMDLNNIKVLPFPVIKSISRLAGSSKESSNRLAWGVKFGIKRGLDAEHKELAEQEFNRSLDSWMKFFPSIGDAPAFVEGEASNDTFQNNFFSLEKVYIKNIASDKISSWDDAEYKRDGSAGSGGRFVVMEKDAKGTNVPYLKFRFFMQGGFDGVNILDKEKSQLSGVAALREGQDEAGDNKFTGPTVMSYRKAVDVLKDKTTFELQLLAIPGIRSSQVTDYAITACEDRFDAMLVMDIEEVDDSSNKNLIVGKKEVPSALNTVDRFIDRALDTSFAAAYFPDVVSSKPSDRSSIVVPPSVVMLGAIALNDRLADPWFAPAGLTRGRLNASDSRLRMPRSVLDQVYDADINPIYVPAGRSGEVFTFGQKTLLRDQSALDRINVRRLLINVRRRVRKIAEQLLFEPNRESTLQRFSQLVEPIMADVQARRGVDRYKVQIDTNTTTQNDIENNTIRGKIYLQPTKSVEFISLDFVVTNSINE